MAGIPKHPKGVAAGSPEPFPESDRASGAPHPREMMGLVGHLEAERRFLHAYQKDRLAHAWLIGGPQGIGKATLAWRFAKFLLAHPDPHLPFVQEAQDLSVDPNSPAVRRVLSLSHANLLLLRRQYNETTKKHYTEIRVEDVRKAIHFFHHAPGEMGWRIAIIDSVEDLNGASANALLKLLEEPPSRCLFLLIAHRPGRLMPTLRSRCQQLILAPLTQIEVEQALLLLAPLLEGMSEPNRHRAVQFSHGSVREALRWIWAESHTLFHQLEDLIASMPHIEWRHVHQVAEKIVGRENNQNFELVMTYVFDVLDTCLQEGIEKKTPLHHLLPFSKIWETTSQALREVEGLNLDRRPLLFSFFEQLSKVKKG